MQLRCAYQFSPTELLSSEVNEQLTWLQRQQAGTRCNACVAFLRAPSCFTAASCCRCMPCARWFDCATFRVTSPVCVPHAWSPLTMRAPLPPHACAAPMWPAIGSRAPSSSTDPCPTRTTFYSVDLQVSWDKSRLAPSNLLLARRRCHRLSEQAFQRVQHHTSSGAAAQQQRNPPCSRSTPGLPRHALMPLRHATGRPQPAAHNPGAARQAAELVRRGRRGASRCCY